MVGENPRPGNGRDRHQGGQTGHFSGAGRCHTNDCHRKLYPPAEHGRCRPKLASMRQPDHRPAPWRAGVQGMASSRTRPRDEPTARRLYSRGYRQAPIAIFKAVGAISATADYKGRPALPGHAGSRMPSPASHGKRKRLELPIRQAGRVSDLRRSALKKVRTAPGLTEATAFTTD